METLIGRTESTFTIDQVEQRLLELMDLLEPVTDPQGERGRPRILPAMCLWVGLVVCVLRGWSLILNRPRHLIPDSPSTGVLRKEWGGGLGFFAYTNCAFYPYG